MICKFSSIGLLELSAIGFTADYEVELAFELVLGWTSETVIGHHWG
jgi:hypothetical protein